MNKIQAARWKEKLEGFILMFENKPTVNLPQLAKGANLKWEKVQEELDKQEWFYDAMKEALITYKYKILQKIETLAFGELRAGPSPHLPSLKLLIDLIDSGKVLGVSLTEIGGKSSKGGTMDEEMLRRFNLSSSSSGEGEPSEPSAS